MQKDDSINTEQPEQPMLDKASAQEIVEEIGGLKGLDPTRFGDWEKNGRCIDF